MQILQPKTRTRHSDLFEFDGTVFTAFMEAVPAPRTTQKQVRLIHVPDHKLKPKQLQIKRRIERYMNFKTNMQLVASLAKLKMSDTWHVIIGFGTDKAERIGKPHQQVPDSDNLLKSIKDALCKKDQHIWDERVTKIWSEKNFITIQPLK